MNIAIRFFVVLILACGIISRVKAQSPASELIKQGVELHNQGKFAAAVDKFNEVLKTDPENPYANYEIAFSLYSEKKPKDAMPHLEKAVKSDNASLNVAAYSLMASIYDEDNQHQKSIDTYNMAIKINPDYPQIYYNLGIAYFRGNQFTEAEAAAIEAIKHNPKNASSQRLYALVTFHQNKRANALLALCNFLLLEPTGARAAEAYGNIQHIIQGGVLTDANGGKTITVNAKDDKDVATLNTGISLVVISAQTKKLTGTDLLQEELKTIFALVGQLAEKKTDQNFFDRFYAAYFYKLAQSNYMPALVHTVTLTDPKSGSAAWAKDNKQQMDALAEWLQKTERQF